MKVLIATVLAAGLILGLGTTATSQLPPIPRNLSVKVFERSLLLKWGPSPPGPYKVTSVAGERITVAWGPSRDTRGGINYRVWRNNHRVADGLGHPYRVFTVNRSTLSFRVCVQAFNVKHQSSTRVCGTITKGIHPI